MPPSRADRCWPSRRPSPPTPRASQSSASRPPSPIRTSAPRPTRQFAAAMKDEFEFEPAFRQHAVQAGHRAGRHAARQSRDVQPRPGRHLQAGAGLVAADLGLPVPRLRPSQEDIQERRRPGDDQAWSRDKLGIQLIGAGLFRHPPGQPEAHQEDQHAGRSRRHEAAHAARRVLAVPRRIDRRQPDASRLRRGLHRAADRRDRRPGQSPGAEPDHEVLRGHHAVRADRSCHRLRHVRDLGQGVGRAEARAADEVRGRGREGVRRLHRQVQCAGEGDRRLLQGAEACRSTRPTSRPSATFAQKKYLDSAMAKDWPKGMLERINAIK